MGQSNFVLVFMILSMQCINILVKSKAFLSNHTLISMNHYYTLTDKYHKKMIIELAIYNQDSNLGIITVFRIFRIFRFPCFLVYL